MAALDFPSTPSNGQTYTANGLTYTFDSTKNIWVVTTLAGAPRGYTGSQGTTGFVGSASTTIGFTGSTGFTGSRGAFDAIGFTGSVGFTGSIGFTGSVGFVGSQGATSTTVLLGTLTTTSGTTQTLSGLTLTNYKFLIIICKAVSHNNTAAQQQLRLLDANGSTQLTLWNITTNTNFSYGQYTINLENGVMTGVHSPNGTAPTVGNITTQGGFALVHVTSFSTASTSLQFTYSGTTSFDNGQIFVYGVQ